MDNNRFVVLTGHLSKQPLRDLVGLLRQQRKTGRLLIEYPKGPASLFFDNGELIDVRLNELQGLQAICVVLAQPESAFNFNPLLRSSQRSIEPTLSRVVSELFGHWEEPLQIEAAVVTPVPELPPVVQQPQPLPLEGRRIEPLALPPANVGALRQKSLFAIAASILIIIGISTVIAVTGALGPIRSQSPVVDQKDQTKSQPELAASNLPGSSNNSKHRNRQTLSTDSRRTKHDEPNKGETSTESQTIKEASPATSDAKASAEPIRVVMQIENGRVLSAAIANHSPAMANFEALALRIARQRRYPAAKTGAETVTISVNKPDNQNSK